MAFQLMVFPAVFHRYCNVKFSFVSIDNLYDVSGPITNALRLQLEPSGATGRIALPVFGESYCHILVLIG